MSEPCTVALNESLPPRLTAGDARTWNVTTNLAQGVFVFLVMTAVVNRMPTRQILFEPTVTAGDPPTYTGGVAVDDTGTAAFTLPSTTTAAWAPGRYTWQAFSLDPTTGNRDQIANGEIRVLPNPLGTNPVDPRSYNERVLDQIRALLEGRTLDDVQMYKIGTRELTKMAVSDLLTLEGVYEARVRKERERRGQKVRTKTVGIVFGGR